MQTPVIMDQVLLEWNGGHSVLLARVRDAEGFWVCSKEVYWKLASSSPIHSWDNHVRCCEQPPCDVLMHTEMNFL